MEMNKKDQGKKVTIFAFILSIVSIGILVFGFTLISSEKVVVLQSISNLYNKVSKLSNDDYELLDKIATSEDIGIKQSITFKQEDQSMGFKYNYLENQGDKKSQLDLSFLQNGKELLSGNLALSNNKIYAFLKDITPNYYFTKSEYASFIKSITGKDYDRIASIVKEAISDAVDKKDIEKEKVTIKYNGKDKKVTKLTYKVTTKELEEIITKFVKDLKGDKKLCSSIATVLNTTTNELTTTLDTLTKSLENAEEQELFSYSTYYYGFNKIVEYDIEFASTQTLLQYKVEKTSTITLKQNGIELLTLEVEKDNNNYSFTLTLNDLSNLKKYKLTGTYKNNELIMKTKIEGSEYKLSIKFDTKSTDKSYSSNTKIALLIDDKEMFSVENDLEFYFGTKVDLALDKSVDANNITEDQLIEMMENLRKHPLFKEIFTLEENYKNLPIDTSLFDAGEELIVY